MAPTTFDPSSFTVEVPKWRRILDHVGMTGSTVKPRWRLNAELARFAVEHPQMSNEEHQLVAYAREVEAKDVDSAWSALNAAKRIVLGRTTDENELRMRARALTVEAEQKLTDWRKQAAATALATEDDATPTAKSLVHAQKLIDEHNDNRYRQMNIHARSLRFIGSLVVALLVIFGLVVGFEQVNFSGVNDAGEALPSAFDSLWSYIAIVVLGAMGALLSVFISRIGGPDANAIKDLGARVSGYMRPLLGGLSAVVVVLVLESGVQNVITLGDNGIFVGAMLAGFSERLIDRALGGIAE